jgi:hypothetical protein
MPIRRYFALGRLTSFLLGLGTMALLQVWAPAIWERLSLAPAVPVVARSLQPANIVTRARTPWGEFEYEDLPLPGPDVFLPDSSRPLATPRWYFGNCSRDQLRDFLTSFPFPADHRDALLEPSAVRASGAGWTVLPTRSLILAMDPTARSQLYTVLADFSQNSAQRNPFRFRVDGFDEWFAHSGLGAEQLATLRSLVYTNGGTLCFCDGPVLQDVFSTTDFKHLVKALYGERTFLMRLRVTPDSDIDAIVKYWGSRKRGEEAVTMRPLLEALARVPGGGSVNISHLLPSFARMRLYTYANPAADPTATRQNCFWTSMNFFNEKPDPQFFNLQNVQRVLARDYAPTQEAPAYGDLIVLYNSDGQPVHMCVVLVEDVVYTKNGMDYLQPWVLMRISDMLAYYFARTPVRMVIYRARGV